MKTLNLFFDMEFTSLSPDAEIISLGIVSDCGKSFYAEFTDFDINRCNEWVKENVVAKLTHTRITNEIDISVDKTNFRNDTARVKKYLKLWLSQFSDYHIQFVADCTTFDWYHLLQLIGDWDETRTNEEIIDWEQNGKVVPVYRKIGLPKLPSNISPVPFDLNDLIAIRKGISPKEAFDLYREKLADELNGFEWWNASEKVIEQVCKHSSLWDAKVIKTIYNKLI